MSKNMHTTAPATYKKNITPPISFAKLQKNPRLTCIFIFWEYTPIEPGASPAKKRGIKQYSYPYGVSCRAQAETTLTYKSISPKIIRSQTGPPLSFFSTIFTKKEIRFPNLIDAIPLFQKSQDVRLLLR